MTRWHEEEWGARQLEKLQKAVAEQKHRKIVRILDKIMDEYDVEESEIWLFAAVVEGPDDEVSRED